MPLCIIDSMIKENIDRIFKNIIAYNMRHDLHAIPHSHEFLSDMEAQFGFSKEAVEVMIDILRDSRKILVMEIQSEEESKKIAEIMGYVDADIVTVSKLKNVFSGFLEEEYAKDSGEELKADEIVRKLIPRREYIHNTPVGMLVNKVAMLSDFESLLEREYKQYSDEYKENSLLTQIESRRGILEELLGERGGDSETSHGEKDGGGLDRSVSGQRAVDSPEYDSFWEASSSKSVNKLLSIYGVDFFFRVNLRKHRFSFLREVLATGVFDRRKDLILLRDMLKVIKSNLVFNNELMEFYDEIMALDRELSRAMTFCKK